MYRYILFILLYSSVIQASIAQIGQRYSENEMKFQEAFLKAKSLMINNDYEKAEVQLKKVYDLDRTQPATAFELAKFYEQSGDLEKSIEFSKKATTLDPNNKWHWIFLANREEENYNHKAAADIYAKLIRDFEENQLYYEKLAFHQLSSGDADNALQTLNLLEARIGIEEQLIKRKYDILSSQGKQDHAASELKKLADRYPEEKRYRHNLAAHYTQMGQNELAKQTYENILKVDPSDAKAKFNLIKKNEVSGSSISSIISNQDLTEEDKVKTLIPYISKLTQQTDSLQKSDLLESIKILQSDYPTSAAVQAISGDYYYQIGDYPSAIKHYESTIKKKKSVYAVWYQLLDSYMLSGLHEEAFARGEDALDVFPNQAGIYYLIAKAHLLDQNPTDALDYIQEGKIIATTNPAAALDFETLEIFGLYLNDKITDAQNRIDALDHTAYGKNPQALETVCYLYDQFDKDRDAQSCLHKLKELHPEYVIRKLNYDD